ncbi:hypothetical protein VYU27_007710 [Nannochloropsis oceanica]
MAVYIYRGGLNPYQPAWKMSKQSAAEVLAIKIAPDVETKAVLKDTMIKVSFNKVIELAVIFRRHKMHDALVREVFEYLDLRGDDFVPRVLKIQGTFFAHTTFPL